MQRREDAGEIAAVCVGDARVAGHAARAYRSALLSRSAPHPRENSTGTPSPVRLMTRSLVRRSCIDEVASEPPEPSQGALFVGTRKAAVAHDIGGKDCSALAGLGHRRGISDPASNTRGSGRRASYPRMRWRQLRRPSREPGFGRRNLVECTLRARPGIAESDLTGDSRACVVCVA